MPQPDPASYAAVINEHWTSVYRLLYRLTGSLHDTEDLTQETFLRALDRLATFRPGTGLRSWLLRIATNAFLDARRKRKLLRRQELPDDWPDRGQLPDQILGTQEQAAMVKVVLQELTETARLVFLLRVQEDLPYRAIAEIIGGTEEAARWHMGQARRKLLQHFKGWQEP